MKSSYNKNSSSQYPSFFEKVWQVVKTIPRGETRSYEWVARKAGSSGAARAVGQALARNPFPGIVPCHRVIRKDGKLGGYSLGASAKRCLLEKEGALRGKAVATKNRKGR